MFEELIEANWSRNGNESNFETDSSSFCNMRNPPGGAEICEAIGLVCGGGAVQCSISVQQLSKLNGPMRMLVSQTYLLLRCSMLREFVDIKALERRTNREVHASKAIRFWCDEFGLCF